MLENLLNDLNLPLQKYGLKIVTTDTETPAPEASADRPDGDTQKRPEPHPDAAPDALQHTANGPAIEVNAQLASDVRARRRARLQRGVARASGAA